MINPLRSIRPFVRLIRISRIATIGASLVTAAFIADVLLIFASPALLEGNPYAGIVTYMVLPGLLMLGLVLVPVGLVLRLWRFRHRPKLETMRRLMRFGVLQQPAAITRTIVILTLINVTTFVIISYGAYHFMDSTTFCGEVCHSVMHPEFSAYQRSPHSQVECVECHIGPGAEWFVKSKISGAWQVISVNLDLYEKPIPTPIENLRPARDVCESCHRPAMFHGNLVRTRTHYVPDEKNTPTYTVLNMRVGGGGDRLRQASGIHWHVANDHQLRYYASDHDREKVEWIETVDVDGTKRIWTRPNSKLTEADIDSDELRVMDCVDCHNRPTHIYLPPVEAIEQAMTTGQLDPTLPWIRKVAEQVITDRYETNELADAGIADRTRQIYQEQYPEVWQNDEARIETAIAALQQIHHENVFPSMNIQWNTYVSKIGHPTQQTAGCFRCHDGQFRDEQGQGTPITLDCNACHYILAAESRDPSVLWLLNRDDRLYGSEQRAKPPSMPGKVQ